MAKTAKKRRIVRHGKKKSGGLFKKLKWVFVNTLKVSFVAGIVACSVFGGAKIYKAAMTSPSFEIKSITIGGNFKVSDADVLDASGLQAGQNIIAIDISEAAERIEAHPWVKSVDISRTLPDKVTIDISEESALTLVSLDGLYVVNAEGKIFKRYSPRDGLDLTVITGLDDSEIDDPAYRLDSGVLELIEFLRGREGISLKDISEVNVDSVLGYTLYTVNEGVRLEMGSGDMEEKFTALERVVGIRGGIMAGFSTVDLNNGRGVVVKPVKSVFKKGGEKRNVKKG